MSGDACKALARRDVLLLRAGGDVLEVVVFRRLIAVGSWGDPGTGVSSVRVPFLKNSLFLSFLKGKMDMMKT